MSFKKSVLLLLTVFALISFANQREAAVEAAESLGYIDFSEITQEGAEIALGLVEEFIQDKELDLIPGDVESLYGYGYGDKQIAYMILCHPEGKVRNMSEYQRLLHTKYQLFKERDYYVNLAREQELEYSNALVPEENRSANSEVNKLISGMYLMIVAKVEDQYHLIQSSNIFNLQITHYQRDVFEAYGEPVDYYLTNNYLDYTEYGGDIEYLSFFSVFPIFRDDEGNITRPMEIENPNQGKPKYQHDKMYIQPDEFTRSLSISVPQFMAYGIWDCYFASKVSQLAWHILALEFDYDKKTGYPIGTPVGSFDLDFQENCYDLFAEILDSGGFSSQFPPFNEWHSATWPYGFESGDSPTFSEELHDECYKNQTNMTRTTLYPTSLNNIPKWVEYFLASTWGAVINGVEKGNVSIFKESIHHACVTAGFSGDLLNPGSIYYWDPTRGDFGVEDWGGDQIELCTNFTPLSDKRLVFSEDLKESRLLFWNAHPEFENQAYSVIARDEAGQITQISGIIRTSDVGDRLNFETEAEGELGVRYYPVGDGEPVDVFDGEEADFE